MDTRDRGNLRVALSITSQVIAPLDLAGHRRLTSQVMAGVHGPEIACSHDRSDEPARGEKFGG
ncbi:MAG: hypothetical protein QOK12_4730 [Mycobacterium sp.]|nr:hypothetical protein [Mycobacterium sp.]